MSGPPLLNSVWFKVKVMLSKNLLNSVSFEVTCTSYLFIVVPNYCSLSLGFMPQFSTIDMISWNCHMGFWKAVVKYYLIRLLMKLYAILFIFCPLLSFLSLSMYLSVGHCRSREVSHHHFQLLPWSPRHYRCIWRDRSGRLAVWTHWAELKSVHTVTVLLLHSMWN